MPRRLGQVHRVHHSPSTSSVVQTVTATVFLVVLATAGVDPLVGVFGSMAGVATVGMVILMLTTSLSVVVFFLRRTDLLHGRRWQTRIAPALACVGLAATMWLVLTNFTLVTGGSTTLSTVLAIIPFLGLAVGATMGQPTSRTAPAGRSRD